MYLNEIGTIEDKYKCSGIWEKLPIYFFSDSSVGKPTQRCLEPIKEHFYGGMIIFGSLFIAIAFLILLVVAIHIVYACLPIGKKEQDISVHTKTEEDLKSSYKN